MGIYEIHRSSLLERWYKPTAEDDHRADWESDAITQVRISLQYLSILFQEMGFAELKQEVDKARGVASGLRSDDDGRFDKYKMLPAYNVFDMTVYPRLRATSLRVWGAYYAGIVFMQTDLYLSVIAWPQASPQENQYRYLKIEWNLDMTDRQDLAVALGSDVWQHVIYSIEKWKGYRNQLQERNAKDPALFARMYGKVNKALDDQLLKWNSLIISEKSLQDFVDAKRLAVLYLIPIAILAAAAAALVGGLYEFSLLPNVPLGSAVNLVFYGGISAAALNLLVYPIKGAMNGARSWLIRRSLTVLPKIGMS